MNLNKQVYVYDIDLNYISSYKSITFLSTKLRIPRSSIDTVLDRKDIDIEKKTCKSKLLYSNFLSKYLILRTSPIPKSKKKFKNN